MRVALVTDWLNQYGGAERVLEVLHDLYPTAPIYTSLYAPQAVPEAYRSWDIRTSFMQHLPLARTHHQAFLPFYPLAFERFDFSGYDLVLSNASAFAHGVVTPPETTHICYCLTPTRFLWQFYDYVKHEGLGWLARFLLPPLIARLRRWDYASAQRVNHFIAISQVVAQRIAQYYRRESAIIYPPVNTAAYHPADKHGDYFLVLSRLVPYKRVDLAVQACSELGLPLLVIGEGRDRARLERLAGPSVRFLGRLPDAQAKEYFARCRAFIFPGEEDFGITPLEAQAAGRPVIAYAAGGALDTVVEGVTGAFFRQPTAQALAETLRAFDERQFDPAAIRAHALRFDTAVFRERLTAFIAQKLGQPPKT